MVRLLGFGPLVLVVLAVPAVCSADGVMFSPVVRVEAGEAARLVTSPKQEAVLIFDGHTVQVILRTHFHAGPKEVAWFVPVPSKPTDVVAGRDRIFEALHEATVPRFSAITRGSKKGLGCSAGGTAQPVGTTVVVESRGTAGIYEWVVLAGKDAGDLVEWLKTNRFAVPAGAERGFRRYVDEGWHWLAMKVRPELTETPLVAPHPVVYTYEDTKLVYPLAISRLSSAMETEVVLYVLAGGRYMAENWANAPITNIPVALSDTAASGTTYEKKFQRATDERGGRLFVTECARNLDTVGGRSLLGLITQRDPRAVAKPPTPFRTRLRAVVSLRAMDRDVVLVPQHPTGNEWVDNHQYLRVSASGESLGTGLRLAGLTAAVILGLVLVRRERLVCRLAAVGCLVCICLIVAG